MSGNRRRGGRRERGGSGARRALRSRRFDTTPLPYIQRKVPVFDVLSQEGLEIIENNAEAIMEEVGIAIKDDPDIIAMWRDAGADVADDGETLHFPRGLARSLLASAPSSFIQRARNPQRNVKIGDGATVFAPVYGPPFIHNLDDGRRYATIEDFRNFVKLAYMTPAMHHSGGTVCEPVDIPVNKRHLDMVHAHLAYSDKPFMGSVTAPERAADTVELARIALGGETVDNHCCIINLINANSPMTFDGTMLGALKVYAAAGQACVVSPFILSGAMSPVTVAGTVAQILAEALVGMATTQLVRKGAPVVFGTFGSSISMQSGAPTFGTPEPALVLFASAQLARRLGVPFRSGGSLCGSKVPDAQAAYESAQTLLPTLLGGVNFVLHAAGWLEGGLASGYEKFVMDADQIGMMQVLGRGVDLSENGQAMDAIREVGPGSHFLGCDHTQNNFQSAFYRSTIADNNSFEQWEADGSLDAARRANQLWKDMLADYEAPAMDPAVAEELDDWIARRKSSMPDSFT
ncbi:MAG: trimethylamine methyltransferase family protein [bacterium]|nr:trimethylamine methyltransferase family protein [bacterium]